VSAGNQAAVAGKAGAIIKARGVVKSFGQTPALRGATVALVDTRILFGLDAAIPATTALIVVRGHRTVCGLTVDRVLGVARFVETRFSPAVRGREPPQIAGFMSDEAGGLLTVLDTSTILQSLENLRFWETHR